MKFEIASCYTSSVTNWLTVCCLLTTASLELFIMRRYELIFLFRSGEKAENAQKQVEDLVKELKGKILKKEEWGVKDLAYKVLKEKKALYLFFKAELPEKAIAEMNRKVRLTENILRHLIIADSK